MPHRRKIRVDWIPECKTLSCARPIPRIDGPHKHDDSQSSKRAGKQSQIRISKVDSSRQSGVLVLLGVLFTIILAGLDNTIVSTVMPVALPELGGAHLYAWTFAAYMLAAAVSMPIWGPGSDR